MQRWGGFLNPPLICFNAAWWASPERQGEAGAFGNEVLVWNRCAVTRFGDGRGVYGAAAWNGRRKKEKKCKIGPITQLYSV